MTPQIIYLALILISLGINMARDGEPDEYNFLMAFISKALALWILYEGGFFDVMLK